MNWKAEQILEQALVAVRGRDYDRALALCQAAIHEDNDLVEAWTLRGNILLAQERFFDASLHYEQAIARRSTAADAMNNLGQANANMGQWEDAEEWFRKSIECREAREPHMGLANMFATLMRLDEAAAEYKRVVDMDPTDHEAHFNLGVTLLGLGRWGRGFKAYHHRHLNNEFPPAARRLYPEWTGQDLAGKTLLLYPEQGYGDEIMAARFANHLDCTVILEARAPFARLAKSMGGFQVVTRGDPYPDGIDYSCSVMDVPMALGLGPTGVPRPRHYVWGHAETSHRWRQAMPPGFNVGLCWGSGKHLSAALGARQMKSIPIGKLRDLAMPGVNLISLQKPAEPTPPEMGVYDWTDELHDLADTAALIAGLDLVITVDTAVAHLAGALGKPVWNFVRFSGYWPWLAPGAIGLESLPDDYSIWYPSMRLLRQTALNDWSGPIETAVRDLRALVAQREAAE